MMVWMVSLNVQNIINTVPQQPIFRAHKVTQTEFAYWTNPDNVVQHFSQREREGIFHEYAAAVRYEIKKEIAKLTFVDICDIEIIRKSINHKMQPPYVLLRQETRKQDERKQEIREQDKKKQKTKEKEKRE